MGCTSGKISQDYQKYQQMMQKLITSFQSIEQYIQSQRSTVFSYLSKNGENEQSLETPEQRDVLINFTNDVNLFRKYKQINKYKYEITIPKFLKNIKFCIYKMQLIHDMYNQFFDQISIAKLTVEGQKYIKKNEEQITHIQNYMQMISSYLQMNKETEIQTLCQISDFKNMNQPTSASELDIEEFKTK